LYSLSLRGHVLILINNITNYKIFQKLKASSAKSSEVEKVANNNEDVIVFTDQ